jgi:diguanylate cyclase
MEKSIKQLITILLKNYKFNIPDNKRKVTNLLVKMNKSVSSITAEELFQEISRIMLEESKRKQKEDEHTQNSKYYNSLKELLILLLNTITSAYDPKSPEIKDFKGYKNAIARSVICKESSRLQTLIEQIIKSINNLSPFMEEEKKEFTNIIVDFTNLTENLEHTTESATEKITDISVKLKNTKTFDDFKNFKNDLVNELNTLNSEFSSMKEEIKKNNEELKKLKTKMEELQKASEHDPLTGVLNRKGFEKQFENQLERIKRYGDNAVLAIMDIDDFKTINDTYGHLTGDEVLKAFTDGVNRITRKNDILSRIGGDEFVLILIECDEKKTEQFFAKLYAFFNSNIYNTGKSKLKIHVSSGATNIKPDDNLESVLERADKALYLSKKQGKNRLTIIQ